MKTILQIAEEEGENYGEPGNYVTVKVNGHWIFEPEALERFAARIRAEQKEWISVEDRLPAEGETCAVLVSNGDCLTAWPTYWHGASTAFNCWTFPHPEDSEETVTHWMPLPSAIRNSRD